MLDRDDETRGQKLHFLVEMFYQLLHTIFIPL